MSERKSKILLLLGCQRSGTTLLAAMLGGHSEINMLFESTSDDVLKLIGKKYSGNKSLVRRQIRFSQRSSKFGHLMNRLANLDLAKTHRHHKKRPFPTSKMSIQDYINEKATIITITRNKEEVLKSITSRTKMSWNQAEKEYDLAIDEMNTVKDIALNINFADLVKNPENTLKEICKYLDLDFEKRMLKGPEYNFVYPNKSVISDKSQDASLK